MPVQAPLSVLFLWHQHQPLYKDALTGNYELPWVRLHATKDYLDMVTLLEEFPSIKANFNLVPSLLAQLDDYGAGKARDRFLDVTLKRAADLALEDRIFILENFFMAHWEFMVDPHRRYRELLEKRGRLVTHESLARAQNYFKEQDWRDLQTWFNLAWFDPLWREKDPLIKGLYEKGNNFTEVDKQALIQKQLEMCRQVVAKHKEMQERGQIEVTTTPFYHPILPLLCDTESARVAQPHINLPFHPFKHPEDAREQLQRARQDYERRFGGPPQGLWPSEGSVSEEAVRLIAEAGIRWIATDEEILAHSLETSAFVRDDLYEPYRMKIGGQDLFFFFRDHELSDAIGFVYSTWEPDEAADDFVRRLKKIQSSHPDPARPHVVSVILDGENCWEYYRDDGLPFLRALYSRLAAEPGLETVRASDYLNRHPVSKVLPKLWSGSWINSNFAIWIGHSEDNRAWDFLYRTRRRLQEFVDAHPESRDQPNIQQAWDEIYAAEGSDWCWWYGDDHSSYNDAIFDFLFRKHLMNVHTLMGDKVPDDLHFPIKKKRLTGALLEPIDFIHPTIDGKVTNYFEWQSAGLYRTQAGATGTMHKSENLVQAIYYGFDLENLYFRIDFSRILTPENLTNLGLRIIVHAPTTAEIDMAFEHPQNLKAHLRGPDSQPSQNIPLSCAYAKIIELCLPLSAVHNPEKSDFQLTLTVLRDALEQERWPSDTTLTIPFPKSDIFAQNWTL